MNKLEPYFALIEKFGKQGKYFKELISLVPKAELKKFISNIGEVDHEDQRIDGLNKDVACFYNYKKYGVNGNLLTYNFVDEDGKNRGLTFFFADAENLLEIQTLDNKATFPLFKLQDSKCHVTYTLIIGRRAEDIYEIGLNMDHDCGLGGAYNQYTMPEFNKLLQDAGFTLSEFSLKN